jgi:hypothetical protein
MVKHASINTLPTLMPTSPSRVAHWSHERGSADGDLATKSLHINALNSTSTKNLVVAVYVVTSVV